MEQQKHILTKGPVLAAVLMVGLAVGVAVGWGVRPLLGETVLNHEGENHDDGSEEGHDDHEGHAHAEHAAMGASSLEDLEAIQCEHQIGILNCDECRYEAGAVKIDPSLDSLIETGRVEDVDRTQMLTLTGQIQLDRTKAVEVVSFGAGRVKRIDKFLGDRVQQGDVLAVIHSADLGQAKANFLEVQAALELAEATFQREKDLYEKKISSEADYLDARNALTAAEAAQAAADKRLRLFGLSSEQIAEISDEQTNGDFADLVLRAPQSGTLITQNVSVGQIVDTTDSLYTIADLSNLWVWCDVYEADLGVLHERLQRAQPLEATVHVKAFESDVFEGVVDFAGNVMDEHTRTVKIRVQVTNPNAKLRPGMFADVQVALSQPGRVPAVPQSAVVSDAGQAFIFQQLKGDLWVRRDVTTGAKYGRFVELLGNIPSQAPIVTGGAFMLKSDVLREKMGAGCAD